MSEAATRFTLLVNSCDGFEDCWTPFFTLLERYWQEPLPTILLNTERKVFAHPGMEIRSSQVQVGHEERLTWSECLAAALAMVDTSLVLYMQEDYFIERPVDLDMISYCAEQMINDPQIHHIGLTHFGAGSPILPDPRPSLSRIGPRASYRLSTQAGLWRKEALEAYLKPWESGWMFELFGTVRSWKRSDLFLTLDRAMTKPAIDYQHTGIVKGQWSSFVPELFEKEGIRIDFLRRGFYGEERDTCKRRFKLLRELIRHPRLAYNSILS